jgi:transcriptional regulator with XRE-family HTH domain
MLPKKYDVDTNWFRDRLAEIGLSQRDLARRLVIENSALSLMLNGRQGVYVDVAWQLSLLLGQDVEIILVKLGAHKPKKKSSSKPVGNKPTASDSPAAFATPHLHKETEL